MADAPTDRDRAGTTAWRLIEPYWKAVSIYDGAIAFLDAFEKLPIPVRHLFAVSWCDSEVCNGGLHQFFSNSTGVLAPEASEGFQVVGLNECARFVEIAIEKFGDPYPRDREARQLALEEMRLPGEKRKEWDLFYDLDNRYYAAKDRVNFYGMLDAFAKHGL